MEIVQTYGWPELISNYKKHVRILRGCPKYETKFTKIRNDMRTAIDNNMMGAYVPQAAVADTSKRMTADSFRAIESTFACMQLTGQPVAQE
jgi:hypothetical protein